MILQLRNDEFPCHKIVFQTTSEYFKKAMKENEIVNKFKYGIEGPFR